MSGMLGNMQPARQLAREMKSLAASMLIPNTNPYRDYVWPQGQVERMKLAQEMMSRAVDELVRMSDKLTAAEERIRTLTAPSKDTRVTSEATKYNTGMPVFW